MADLIYNFSEKCAKMKKLAEKYHSTQTRKGKDKIPYIVHPEAVVNKLLRWGEDVSSLAVAMAWGHDLMEDTTVSDSEILEAGGKEVFDGIKILTHSDTISKDVYLKNIAASAPRNVLLVKIADRISNSEDFISYKGKLHAYQYLHQADCLVQALEKFADDAVVENALQAWREIDENLRSDAQYESIRGCLLGGAVGDALGAPIEFMSLRDIYKFYGDAVRDYVEFYDGTGAITDDTQMTLFTAEGILRANVRSKEKGICCPESVVKFAYLRWLYTQGTKADVPQEVINSGKLIKSEELFAGRAPGMTCISALHKPLLHAENNSKGCGTVMRLAPVGLFFDPQSAYEYGCKFSAITHGHPTGIIAGGAFAMLISYLRNGKSLSESLDLLEEFLQKEAGAEETLSAICKARRANDIAELGEGWVAEEALAIGIYCALHNSWDFEKGVIEAINITGDSDSTGAIAGNILGVMNGEKNIPERWLKNLREYNIVSEIADDLHTRFESDADGHVTDSWWQKYPGF